MTRMRATVPASRRSGARAPAQLCVLLFDVLTFLSLSIKHIAASGKRLFRLEDMEVLFNFSFIYLARYRYVHTFYISRDDFI